MTTPSKMLQLPLLVLLLALSSVSAALHPANYFKEQQAAPEEIKIKVIKKSHLVEKGKNANHHHQKIDAIVLSVTRSKAGLKKGDKIRITYTHTIPNQPVTGDGPIPLLELDKEYPAWLRKTKKGTFSPAARVYSFKVVPKKWRKEPSQ